MTALSPGTWAMQNELGIWLNAIKQENCQKHYSRVKRTQDHI